MKNNFLQSFFERQAVPVWGVADLTGKNSKILPENLKGSYQNNQDYSDTTPMFTAAVVYAFPLSNSVLDLLSGGPDLLYLHHYRQVNYLLDRVGLLISDLLRQKGFTGLPVPASQIVDWKNQRGLLSLKHLGAIAGLGWIGRNNLLVTPNFGSRVRLSAVLTNAPLETGKPLPFGCGECVRCLSLCPTQAIKKEPGDFDLAACSQFIKNICRRRNISQNICGLCLCSASDRLGAAQP